MVPSVLIRLLQLTAIALVATSAFSQAPPKYDPATETTVKGTVGELKLVRPTGGKPIAYLVTKTGPDKEKDTVQVFLCPKRFLDQTGIAFKTDEAGQGLQGQAGRSGSDPGSRNRDRRKHPNLPFPRRQARVVAPCRERLGSLEKGVPLGSFSKLRSGESGHGHPLGARARV